MRILSFIPPPMTCTHAAQGPVIRGFNRWIAEYQRLPMRERLVTLQTTGELLQKHGAYLLACAAELEKQSKNIECDGGAQ